MPLRKRDRTGLTAGGGRAINLAHGHALDLLEAEAGHFDLVATDPPYAFSGSGPEHALSATVVTVLRESARRLLPGGWLLVFTASSWRSTSYVVESVRGLLEPVRFAFWGKPRARTRARTSGWAWASVHVLAFRRRSSDRQPVPDLDYIIHEPVLNGRRAELPAAVADWAVRPFSLAGGRMLDPFAGSGALCLAAERCGMNAIGYDLTADSTL
jgi:DNA modification methylase